MKVEKKEETIEIEYMLPIMSSDWVTIDWTDDEWHWYLHGGKPTEKTYRDDEDLPF